MDSQQEGGCLCGAVRFRVQTAPLRTLACHCTFCQKMTGTAYYAESIFPIGAVEFSGIEMSRYVHRSDGSGKQVHLHFCPVCATTVSLTFERFPEIRAISRGTFDDPNWVALNAHIWTRSAQDDVVLPANFDCYLLARTTQDGSPLEPERYASARLIKRN